MRPKMGVSPVLRLIVRWGDGNSIENFTIHFILLGSNFIRGEPIKDPTLYDLEKFHQSNPAIRPLTQLPYY